MCYLQNIPTIFIITENQIENKKNLTKKTHDLTFLYSALYYSHIAGGLYECKRIPFEGKPYQKLCDMG